MHAGRPDGPITSINVTPLVDILLVLLIIFMTTAPLIHNRMVKINVPKAAHSRPETAQSLTIVYDARKRLLLSGRPVNAAALKAALGAALQGDPNLSITLAADKSLGYGEVMAVLDAVRGAGARRIGLEVAGK
ncbi:MAG: biopolymer transporter ExbD [Elusimicrobia bacterium]|nr:biopolymer transporter ExbD [Elusimicrobiota bacterium]